MYVTLVFPRPQPGKAEEYAQRWKAILAPRVRALPGFRFRHQCRDLTLGPGRHGDFVVLAEA